MFYMVSEHGNAHRKVKSERKRDELIALGYHEVKAPVEEERGVEDVAPYDGPQQTDEPQQVDDPLQMYTTEDDTQGAAIDEDDTQGAATEEDVDGATTEDDTLATADIDDDIEEGAQAAAEGDNATEDDTQAEVNPKKGKTKKNAAEE